jgi:hypothetical protein
VVDNEKVGVDNEESLELTTKYFSYTSAKMQQNILLHCGMITPNILV